ncbi:LamG-like jellyroll fold domain-containing protein, partial [Desulfocastanea catecholica]
GSELRLYVDGVLEGTTRTSYGSDFIAPSAKLTIGWMETYGLGFKGDLDEVALHDQVLTPDSIAVHYNNGM